ncbi:kinase-like domain-containing protein, partial [Mycena pura]
MSDSESDDWLFVFSDLDRCEPSEAYTNGGFCPIKLGDMLGPGDRYRIVFKLGFGNYSTVWLARDCVLSNRIVALKVIEADQTRTGQRRELDILKRLAVPDSILSKEPRAIQLLDSFETTSANGVHQVLVTELVVPLYAQDRSELSPFRPRVTKDVLRQIVGALASIHSRGIAHGDLHPTNFGIAVPKRDGYSDIAIWEQTCAMKLHPLVPTSPDLDPNTFPPYLCCPMDMGLFLHSDSPKTPPPPLSVRILDFDSAYVVDGSHAPQCETLLFYAAPEVAFPRIALQKDDAPWDQRSDIWSLAVAFHDLVGAQGIYGSLSDPKSLPHLMAALCGEVPDDWREYIVSHAFPPNWTPAHTAELWKQMEADFAAAGADDPPGLVRLMRRMMVLDPAKRPTAAELLNDPYFVGTKTERLRESNVLPCAAPEHEAQDQQSNRASRSLPSSASVSSVTCR